MGGVIWRKLRYITCKQIFDFCGKNVNIERMVYFGKGDKIRIGNNSGIGANSFIPNGCTFGDDVMIGPNLYVLAINHKYDRLDVPMNQQGNTQFQTLTVDNDVWIGRNVTITPGRHINSGSIIGAECLLCKDFPPYSVIGGNPSILIKTRKK